MEFVFLIAALLQLNTLVVGDSEAGFASRRFKEVKLSNETIHLEAKGGTTIQYWTNGAFHKALAAHPQTDTVIIFLGTNNVWSAVLPEVSPILNEIKNKNIKCIWVGPTAVHGKKWKINQLLKVAVSETCTYIDTETLDIPLEDGIHPTWGGILKWLKIIWATKL